MAEATGELDCVRVLHLVSAEGRWEPFTGIIALSAALRERGITSVVTAPEHSRLWELAEAYGVETVDYAVERSMNPFRWKDLGALVKRVGAGIVHAHDVDAATLLSRARLFGGGTKVVVSRHDLSAPLSGVEYGGGVDALVCPSEALARAYIENGAPAEKVHVVYNGVNLPAAERAIEDREAIRANFREAYCPGKEKPRFLVNIAPLDARGGQMGIIEALPDILAALPQAHLFLMGEGEDYEELERQVRLHAVVDEVSFLEPDKAFLRLLAASDLYVASGSDDVSGFMVQTAMVAGCAVAARDSGCYRELLDDGKCGVIADGGEDGFKEAVLGILKNRQRREQLARLGRARAVKEYGAAVQAGKVAEIYGGVCPR